MSPQLQIVLLAILAALFIGVIFASRRWVRQQPNLIQAQYRLLCVAQVLLTLSVIGLIVHAVGNRTQPFADTIRPFLILILVVGLVEGKRWRIRKQIADSSGGHGA
jgi:DMSO reductase anchor subunit